MHGTGRVKEPDNIRTRPLKLELTGIYNCAVFKNFVLYIPTQLMRSSKNVDDCFLLLAFST